MDILMNSPIVHLSKVGPREFSCTIAKVTRITQAWRWTIWWSLTFSVIQVTVSGCSIELNGLYAGFTGFDAGLKGFRTMRHEGIACVTGLSLG